MKNIKQNIILIATVLATTVANATVRTLNNNNPSPGQYTTWGTVQAASSIGDTVYVSGSPFHYGTISVTVYNLCIIGTGHNPQKQNPVVSEFIDINGTVGQMRIEGVKCRKISLSPTFGVAQLFLENSYLSEEIRVTVTDFDIYLQLHNNIVNGDVAGRSIALENYAGTGLGKWKGNVTNNIFRGSIYASHTPLNQAIQVTDYVINNNLFIKNSGTPLLFSSGNGFSNGTFSNNIILGFSGSNMFNNGTNMFSENNLSYPNSLIYPFPTGSIVADPLLVNYPCPSWICAFSTTYDYHLSASSPGKNAGTDGTDIGPYGGPYGASFTTYGEPSIPQMKQMNMPTTVPSGGSFNVNIISTVK